MKFSIIIVTYNRPKELLSCLESIRAQRIEIPYEVLVIFNGDRSYFEKFSRVFSKFKMQFIHKTTPSNARNHGLLKAQGEYIFFLDDDCTLPADYFSHIDFNTNWDVLGGPDQTPKKSTPFQVITGRALSSSLCMGPTKKRHTSGKYYFKNADERMLILCNLWFKASLFKNEGFKFNADLFRNEENFLLKELKEANKIIHYSPKLLVYHQRKNDFEKLGLSIIKSGECRVQNFSLKPNSRELLYFLPLFWLIGFFYALFHPESLIVYFYAAYTALVAFQYLFLYKLSHFLYIFLYIFLHYFTLTTYSIGLIKGLWKFAPQIYAKSRANKSFISESKSK